MKKVTSMLAAACVGAALVFVASAAAGSHGVTDGTTAPAAVDTGSAIVQLKGDPLSTYVKTKPAPGKKIDFSSNTVKSYRAQLSAERNDYKKWLQKNAPGAKITGQFDISLNAVAVQLNGNALGLVSSAPQVQSASYEGLYTPQGDPDLSLISAFDAWGGNTPAAAANAGKGVKVAVIDTGIDITSPCFDDAGYPATHQLGDTTFTNNKVIVARVFNNKTPSNGYTPEALQEHGTHVSGTIACDYNTPATVAGAAIPYGISGVAPAAQLGNYNVFPGDVLNARSEDILNALEAAYQDGMDVANLSLGGNSHGIQDLLTNAIDDLDQAGMVIAVANGNSGPGFDTVESPGSAQFALGAGASTVGHFVATPLTVGTDTYPAVPGDFPTVTSDLTAPLGVVLTSGGALSNACTAGVGANGAPAAGSLTGKIAVISRGACTFSEKLQNAQNAGAIAGIVVNSVPGDATAMATSAGFTVTIPAYMSPLSAKAGLIAADGQSATIGAAQQYFVSGNDDIMASFSSQGPTDVDFRVKPDVVAPGVNVLSSIPSAFCGAPPCFAFFQGTSMATPHLAGSAAFLISKHPDWTSDEVRSAIVNTADQGVLKKTSNITALETNPLITGSGRENLNSATNASVMLAPVSVSFGAVPQGSGQSDTRTVELLMPDGPAPALSVQITGGQAGVHYSAALNGTTVTVSMSEDKGAANGSHPATLSVFSGTTEVAHAVVYTFVKS